MKNECCVHEETYKGFSIKILSDENPQNPRGDDYNVGTMVCWHSRYHLGDVQPSRDFGQREYFAEKFGSEISEQFDAREEKLYRRTGGGHRFGLLKDRLDERREKALAKWVCENLVILDLYLYDHSGITMRTSPFDCRWDSGQVGFIYCTLETAFKEWGTAGQKEKGWNGEANFTLSDDGSKRTLREATALYLEGEVETYDQYLAGQVYGYIVGDGEDDNLDSCWGFFDKDAHKSDSYIVKEARSVVDGIIKSRTRKHTTKVKQWIKNKVPMGHRQPLELLKS